MRTREGTTLTATRAERQPWVIGSPARLLAAALVCGSSILLFAVHARPIGYLPLVLGIALGLAVDRALGRDLALIGVGMGIISAISLRADLSDGGMVRFTVALSLAVLVPWALSRWLFGQRTIAFPVATGRRWSRTQILYLVFVVVAGYLILPIYFIGLGAYRNWPDLAGGQDIARLFVGVNAVGIWDELFFICTVFALLRSHFGVWIANLAQSVVFVSFLWELGYREWGPLLTVPFALIQGWIFAKSASLTYVIAVHLLFDVVVFGVLVHAHHPELLDIFITAPR